MNIPPNGRKRGRPRSAPLEMYRGVFPEWSERTRARYAAAMRLLDAIGYDPDRKLQIVKKATRANGNINVSKLEQFAAWLAIEHEYERPAQD